MTKIKECRKKNCPFLLERADSLSPPWVLWIPFSSLKAPNSLSTYLRINSINQMVSTEIWLYSLQPGWQNYIQLAKTKLGADCASDGKEPTCNLRGWVRSLGWEDPLEEGMATHSHILAWRIPINGGAWRATVRGVTELDMTESLKLSLSFFLMILIAVSQDCCVDLIN